jgi:hypothetical protein
LNKVGIVKTTSVKKTNTKPKLCCNDNQWDCKAGEYLAPKSLKIAAIRTKNGIILTSKSFSLLVKEGGFPVNKGLNLIKLEGRVVFIAFGGLLEK